VETMASFFFLHVIILETQIFIAPFD